MLYGVTAAKHIYPFLGTDLYFIEQHAGDGADFKRAVDSDDDKANYISCLSV